MKKFTILAALMLLVSVSTVLAVRTHQRNLTQLTAQNIEALTGGEDEPSGGEDDGTPTFWEWITGYRRTLTSKDKTCKTSKTFSGRQGTTVSYKGISATIGPEGSVTITVDGNEVLCVGEGNGCQMQKCK